MMVHTQLNITKANFTAHSDFFLKDENSRSVLFFSASCYTSNKTILKLKLYLETLEIQSCCLIIQHWRALCYNIIPVEKPIYCALQVDLFIYAVSLFVFEDKIRIVLVNVQRIADGNIQANCTLSRELWVHAFIFSRNKQ